jgi:UDP-3-O-[3-hydroxymyristoyl] glucosamine N-acyltransferase
MVVDAPADTGRYTLRVTLVQENVMWFSELPTPVFTDVVVVVSVARESWTLADVAALCRLTVTRDASVTTLGFVSSPCDGMLAFALTEQVLAAAVQHGCRALIVPHALVPLVPEHIGVIASDTPADVFRQLHNALAEGTDFYGADVESRIHPGARVHPTATVGTHNVRVADGAVVGAGCVINGRVTLGQRVEIGPGAVIGASGFQTIRSGKRWHELVHAGGVSIGDDAIVFANATVARGLFRQDTVIGEGCRIGNNAVVSHNVRLGCRTTVGHGAIVNGNVDAGHEVWIGPGASVANNVKIGDCARVDLGGVVIGNLPPGEHVGGPPAIDHHAMLREVATWRSGRRR